MYTTLQFEMMWNFFCVWILAKHFERVCLVLGPETGKRSLVVLEPEVVTVCIPKTGVRSKVSSKAWIGLVIVAYIRFTHTKKQLSFRLINFISSIIRSNSRITRRSRRNSRTRRGSRNSSSPIYANDVLGVMMAKTGHKRCFGGLSTTSKEK